MENQVYCPICNSLIEYDTPDIQLAGEPQTLQEVYVICPNCNRAITIGTTHIN